MACAFGVTMADFALNNIDEGLDEILSAWTIETIT